MTGRIPEVYRRFLDLAKEQGWTITKTGAGHLKWLAPDGRCAFTAGSPGGDPREVKNTRAKLRRAGLKV